MTGALVTDYERLRNRMFTLAETIEHVAQQLRDVDHEPQRADAYTCAAWWLRNALADMETARTDAKLPQARNDAHSGPCNDSATAYREWRENRLDAADRAFERRYRR